MDHISSPAFPNNLDRTEYSVVDMLTQRELAILQMIATGLSRKEIAAALYLSLNTVKTHTQNLYRKMNVHSRTQALALAQRWGIIPPTHPTKNQKTPPSFIHNRRQ
ncbi:MAG: response regulator transcription factor [Chloroflexi bacterium]|nr:response regulator transcription factor [Chloroflexota bacterium]MBP8055877.1 response regulator transcription factor [Chloroflexota bacterium]